MPGTKKINSVKYEPVVKHYQAGYPGLQCLFETVLLVTCMTPCDVLQSAQQQELDYLGMVNSFSKQLRIDQQIHKVLKFLPSSLHKHLKN